jgi:putative addiction module component (TIGR02574 family)
MAVGGFVYGSSRGAASGPAPRGSDIVTHVTDDVRELLEKALKLDPDVRLRLADAIYESVDGDEQAEIEEAWEVELERRVKNMPPPGAPLPTTDEVFARVRAKLDELRRAK